MKTIEKVHVLDYHEFDELVRLYLNQNSDYEVVAAEEWSNYEDHFYEVEPIQEYEKEYYEEYTKPDVEKFVMSGEWGTLSPTASDILEYLANETGDIEFGRYLIRVSW